MGDSRNNDTTVHNGARRCVKVIRVESRRGNRAKLPGLRLRCLGGCFRYATLVIFQKRLLPLDRRVADQKPYRKAEHRSEDQQTDDHVYDKFRFHCLLPSGFDWIHSRLDQGFQRGRQKRLDELGLLVRCQTFLAVAKMTEFQIEISSDREP